MSDSEIPWDAPSRYGAAGLLARRVLRRALRPVTVRTAAEIARLDRELSALRASSEAATTAHHAELQSVRAELGSELARAAAETDRLCRELASSTAYGAAVDDVLGSLLVRDLPARSRRRTPGGDGSRVICSLATGDDYRALLSRSALSFETYAQRWGWELVLSSEELSDGRPAPWAKIPFIRSLLDEYEWVLWLDADVVIVDLEADISLEIEPDKDLYLVERTWHGQYTANCGVMLIRNSDWTRAFLDQVWALDRYCEHPWWENAAVLDLLGYGLAPARQVRPTPWLQRTKLIDPRWNSIELARVERPAIVHRGFYDTPTRSRQLTGDLACALGRADPLTAGWDRPARRITSVADVARREEIPLLLNALTLTGTGIEVGVRKGHYSEHLLEHWRGERLVLVDPWRAAPADDYVDISNVEQDAHDVNRMETASRVARFGDRSELWQTTSEDAAREMAAESLDFVYLDARHDAASVTDDLRSWWPRVRPGGLIAGHDYLDGTLPQGVFGVRSAVDAFFANLDIDVHATTDDAPWPSWLVRKPLTPPSSSVS
ncbi:MAG: class I SAM-dependent methyltransferase [Solirubrobacteraceae bacterium]